MKKSKILLFFNDQRRPGNQQKHDGKKASKINARTMRTHCARIATAMLIGHYPGAEFAPSPVKILHWPNARGLEGAWKGLPRARSEEAQAKRRLADEYDAAQERGEVGKRGDFGGVTSRGEDTPTIADIHEARIIRAAERITSTA